jgi:hypothetical protein
MIKRIICPVDFSKAGANACEYAAQLAQVFGAELLFMNSQRNYSVHASVNSGGIYGESLWENTHMAMSTEMLRELSYTANRRYGIHTDYEVDFTSQSMGKLISDNNADIPMIVMGSNVDDEMNKQLFNQNTYSLIKKANCPILLIPDNVTFRDINKIVFDWDYSSIDRFSLPLLKEFVRAFSTQFTFLHISNHRSEINYDLFRALRNEIVSLLGSTGNVEFEHIYSTDVLDGINCRMNKLCADILSVTTHSKNARNELLSGIETKKLIEKANYPVLVLHT